jgi:hypothetical protein
MYRGVEDTGEWRMPISAPAPGVMPSPDRSSTEVDGCDAPKARCRAVADIDCGSVGSDKAGCAMAAGEVIYRPWPSTPTEAASPEIAIIYT